MSKLTKMFDGDRIVSAGCFFLGNKPADTLTFSVNDNTGNPTPSLFIPSYTLETALIIRANTLIVSVLGVKTNTKVVSSIIQAIMVVVVNLWGKVKNQAMHGNDFTCGIGGANRIESLGFTVPLGTPVPLREPFKIPCIDNRVLALREGYKAARWIKWLDDFVSAHGSLHRPLFYYGVFAC